MPTVSPRRAACYPFAANIAVSAVSEAELPARRGGLTTERDVSSKTRKNIFGCDLPVQAECPLSPRVFEGSLQNPWRLLHTDGSVLWDPQMLTLREYELETWRPTGCARNVDVPAADIVLPRVG